MFMRLTDEQYLKTPFWGSRNMTDFLRKQGHEVNRKRTQRPPELVVPRHGCYGISGRLFELQRISCP